MGVTEGTCIIIISFGIITNIGRILTSVKNELKFVAGKTGNFKFSFEKSSLP